MIKKATLSLRPKELFKLLGLAALYGLLSWFVLSTFTPEGASSIFFLASGLALAALLLGGRRYAWAVGLGALLTNLANGNGFWVSAAMAFGSALGALLGAWLMQRNGPFDTYLPSLKSLQQIGAGGFVAALVSALVGATSLLLAGVLSLENYAATITHWWMGDALGIVLLTPLILVWWPTASNPYLRPRPRQLAEATLILGLTLLGGGIVFMDWWHELAPVWLHMWFSTVSQNYWMFLLIAWSALRLGARGTSLAMLLLAMQGATGIYRGTDAFAGGPSLYQLTNFWFYTLVLAWVGMTLSIYIAAAKKTTLSLIKSEAAINQELLNVMAAVDQHSIVATTDVQGRIISVNDKLCDISGYSREELLGQNLRLLNSGLHPAEFFQDLYQTISSGRVWHGEIRNQKKTGQFYWLQTSITPFMNEAGEIVKYVAIRTDITARKEYELELQHHRDNLAELVQKKTADLQQNERKLASILENVDACIYLKDREGRYLYANRPLCELFGLPLAEIVGQSDDKFFDAAACQQIRAHDRDVLDLGKTVRKEETSFNIRNGRTSTYLSVKIPLTQEAGDIYALCGISTDITERIRIEQAAHAANQAKSEFLANMSHEIRTPMNGVVGMVDVLQQTELSVQQHRMLETIHSSSMVLLAILNDILDLSKIEAGKLAIEYLPTNLRELTEEVAQLIVTSSTTQALDFFVFVDPDLPRWILIDPTRLRQILMNLLSNALKFTPIREGQPARVVLTVTPCEGNDGAPCVRLCVTDNGIGISEQAQTQLFQPFTQADASTARQFGGTGLGLSISHRLVQLMNGNISVRSTFGEGTEFTVELPLNDAAPRRMQLFDPRLDGVRVLAVTHDAEVEKIISRYCRAAGAQVSVAASLASAHQQLHEAATAPGSTVLLLDRMATDSDPVLHLPANVGLVLLDRTRGESRFSQFTVSTRPLLHNDLIQGLAMANGRMIPPEFGSADERRRPPPTPEAPNIEEARLRGQLILLAEDNETNREVMQAQLKLLGFASEVAEDGLSALALWRTGQFAMLLTDCHMPRMDGFELTHSIRQEEPKGSRLPIVAITANARQGEAERCRARGMDDYLSKPLRLNELGPMLTKWMPLATPLLQQPQPQVAPLRQVTPPVELPLWDAMTLTELVGDNPTLHRRLLEKFLSHAQVQVTDICAAATAGECKTLAGVAHTLKSAARSVGALQLGELCQGLETTGLAGDASSCNAMAMGLPQALAEVQALIRTHLAAQPLDL